MINDLKGNNITILFSLLFLLLIAGTIICLFNAQLLKHIPISAFVWMVIWLGFAILLTATSYYNFVSCYLLGLFSMMISWRIAAIYSLYTLTYLFVIVFTLYVVNFVYCAYHHLKNAGTSVNPIPLAEWQLICMRIYIGLNFIPHFTEKLFAGPLPHLQDVNSFISLGVPDPNCFVWLAGFCEFGAAIALGLGFFMRLGALGAGCYLMVAAYLGHHFDLGFIWVDPGGGWEFTVMWVVLIMSFFITGLHRFSIDQYLEERFTIPAYIKKLM